MKSIVVLFLFAASGAFAQSDSLLATCRICDTLQFSGNLAPFYKKLAAVNADPQGRSLTVLQIGDSHVQMGHFSGGIEAGLRKINPALTNTSFRFPYALTGGYSPRWFRVDTIGRWKGEKMVGSVAETRFALTGHAVVLTGSKNSSGSLHFQLGAAVSSLECVIETNSNWRIVVDSAAVSVKRISDHLSVIRVRFAAGRSDFTLRFESKKRTPRPLRVFGFREFPAEKGIRFESYGSSGGKYSDYAGKCDYCAEQMMLEKPDLVIVSLGTNDAFGSYEGQSYYTLVSEFIARIRKDNPGASILLTTQPDTFFKAQKPASDAIVHAVLVQIAQEYDCALWDLAAVMGGPDSIHRWFAEGLAGNDLLHFTEKGYGVQAQLLVEALERSYKNYVERN